MTNLSDDFKIKLSHIATESNTRLMKTKTKLFFEHVVEEGDPDLRHSLADQEQLRVPTQIRRYLKWLES